MDKEKLVEWMEQNQGQVFLNKAFVYVSELTAAIQNGEFEQEECERCKQELEDSKTSAWFFKNVKFCKFCGRKLREEKSDVV